MCPLLFATLQNQQFRVVKILRLSQDGRKLIHSPKITGDLDKNTEFLTYEECN